MHAGDVIRGALTVSLPAGFHVQSNKPRDPSLIATELSIDAPDGVSVKEIVFPTPVDLKQQGADQPLAVFKESFAIGVQFALAPGMSHGPVKVPARLHYQACDDTTCFAPTNASAEWTLNVVPAAGATRPTHSDVIFSIAFGHGEAPASVAPPSNPANPSNRTNLSNPTNLSNLERFTQAGDTFGGYMGADEFL